MTLLPLAVVSIAAALLLLRGRALRQWAACELGAWLLLGASILLARPLGIAVDTRLVIVAFGVLKLAMLFAFVAFARDVRWSANRAALVALLIYGLVILATIPFPIDGDEPFGFGNLAPCANIVGELKRLAARSLETESVDVFLATKAPPSV